MTLTGGCQCGAVRYEIDRASILTLYCCHCLECQHQSASAFAMSMKVDRAGFRLHGAAPAQWTRATERGGTSRAHFCSTCGTRLYHDTGDAAPMISLKAGSLDRASELRPVGNIWTKRALPWVTLDQRLVTYAGQPETYDVLMAAWKEQSHTSEGDA